MKKYHIAKKILWLILCFLLLIFLKKLLPNDFKTQFLNNFLNLGMNKYYIYGFIGIAVLIIAFFMDIIFDYLKTLIMLLKEVKSIYFNLIKYYNLIMELVVRDIKIKYKRSILGLMWSILNPLLMMTVMTIVFSTLFKSDIENFPIYLLSGQVIFSFFSEATNMSMTSILGNGGLIKKVYIPKYIFPLSKVLFALVNFLFSLIAVVIVAIITRLHISSSILLFPLSIFYIFIFALGVGLILASYAVFFRDLLHLYGILLLTWTYFTPIFYPIKIIPQNFMFIIKLNPMYYFITHFRKVLLYGEVPSLKLNLICLFFSLFILSVGVVVFYKKQEKFILYI